MNDRKNFEIPALLSSERGNPEWANSKYIAPFSAYTYPRLDQSPYITCQVWSKGTEKIRNTFQCCFEYKFFDTNS